ncbi:MAG: hypothetical protein ACOYKM_14505, partial [Caulobacterales bacterium]
MTVRVVEVEACKCASIVGAWRRGTLSNTTSDFSFAQSDWSLAHEPQRAARGTRTPDPLITNQVL